MWVYQILDVVGTLLETLGIYVLVKAYCPNIKNKLVNLIPPAVFFATTYIWTWFIEDVTFRLPVVLILTFLAYKIVTKEAAVNIIAGIMTQQVYLVAANALAETMSSRILNEMTVMVEGRQFLRPQVYILYFLLQIAFMLFFHYFMKKHSGGIDKKSLLAISISFFIIEVFAQTITIAFHEGRADWFNLNIELAAIVVAMLFVILLVYIKNYLYLSEQEQRDKVQDFVSILIENNCADEIHADGNTSKADKFLHGFGISNMKKAAEKYGGTCTTTQANGKFTLKILLSAAK